MRSLPPAFDPLGVPDLPHDLRDALVALDRAIEGEVRHDPVHRALFATDASLYEVLPVGVAFPRNREDLARIVETCAELKVPLTPRGAGTSLAGQTVGPGLIVDIGRHMKAIVALDREARSVTVQPGIILDDLNRALAPEGLFFAPDTSTSNRCMIGGMIGNNSCGSHSVLYGTTRDHVHELDVLLADGSAHRLGPFDAARWRSTVEQGGRLGGAMRALEEIVSSERETIERCFPDPRVRRRNTGYALDDLASSFLGGGSAPADLARFLCGSEGTLALTAQARLRLVDAPRHNIVVAAHFRTLQASLEATVEAVRHGPAAVELMDRRILELSRLNAEQDRNRWFIEGDPAALLVIEFYGDSPEACEHKAQTLVQAFRGASLGYAHPVIRPPRIASVWALRKAGLGVLMGSPGDVKPITLVEDTAVAVEDLPAFIDAFSGIMARHGAECVYYAHASVGELHLRPELNPKDAADVVRSAAIAREVAELVRAFRGSLSGEHGDGRLRSPFIADAMGEEVLPLFARVKRAFDPDGLLNPGNIVDPAPFEANWRYGEAYTDHSPETRFAYADAGGIQRMVERCNGAGVCRRTAGSGGTMCPSYMVTGDERESTRGRANLFRRVLQQGPDALGTSEALHDALDLCLSCKGCRSDCPASVDMARLKADFSQAWIDRHGASIGSRAVAALPRLGGLATSLPGGAALANLTQRIGPLRSLMGRVLDVHPSRTLPAFAPRDAHALLAQRSRSAVAQPFGRVLLYVDEFTSLYEPELAVAAVELLEAGGWTVETPRLGPSGRTWLSKGFVRDAQTRIDALLDALGPRLGEVEAIVGVEPSALLTLVDEAVDLQREPARRERAQAVAAKVRLVEDFIQSAAEAGRFRARFESPPRRVLLHGHCHQKALVGAEPTARALGLVPGWEVAVLPTGCCGMAGSFGYERRHYETSMAIGELVLFPALRAAPADALVVAPGTSCRHQIADGVDRRALHPVAALHGALAKT